MNGKRARAKRLSTFLEGHPQLAAQIIRTGSVDGTRLDRKPTPTVNRAYRILFPYRVGWIGPINPN